MTHASNYTNHLSQETSPYLLQHAANPVAWYPWGPEALEKARRENKPILLSIGYSACHWCHVMAHESFEDPAAAEVMNELFVNIKVDREERPDLDKIYQTAHSLLTRRSGGWPLTMFLTPDEQIPFFGGTYFPDRPRHGMPAFTDLCRSVAAFYREHRDELEQQNRSLIEFMGELNSRGANEGEPLSGLPLDIVRQQMEQHFDDSHGGFGQAPKFPHPTSLERLLRHWASTRDAEPDERALRMVLFTLDRMALGGMYDQIGGGFCRYSVDDYWMIPHFEKMLYDNGPLLAIYAEAFAATGDPLYRDTAEAVAGWVMREMQSPEGGYYSSLDADSEGEEGKFYVWTRDDVRGLLDEQEYALFARRFGLDQTPNFEGHWYPHVFVDWDALAHEFDLDEAQVRALVDSARVKLFAAREQRVHPGRDDKVLTSWNALMIKGMAVAGRHLDRPEWVASAERALDFIRATLWRDGRLLATYKDGRAHLNAYLDDYVFLMDAVLELLQARWRDGDLHFVLELADVVLEHFQDDDHGGFFFTADDHEQLIERPKPLGDESTPAGNGIAAFVFERLGHLLGDTRYLDAAERTLRAVWDAMADLPYGHTSLLLALEEHLQPPQTVVLRGDTEALGAWQRRCVAPYAPRRMSFAIPADVTDLPGLLAERKAPGDGVLAYVCSGTSCSAPVATLADLEPQLQPLEARATIEWQ
jgi:hypothetical protein